MDPATLAIGATIGGGVGTLAALIVFGLIGRFIWRSYSDFDAIRDKALAELRAQNGDLRERIETLERRLDSGGHDRREA
jgi:hypothetical protein